MATEFKDKGSRMYFEDRATLDTKTKRVISMRDGVLEYLGAEIGREPEDKVFKVYRSPYTLANAAMMMNGIPIVDGHVSTDGPPPESDSHILDTKVLEHRDAALNASMAAGHHAEVGDSLAASIESGKRQVSLGYTGNLVPHEEYDFEQVDIQPHHLATEDAGRCGPACSFVDHRAPSGADVMPQKQTENKMPQAFLDENGEVNMQQIVEIASALPEAIKNVPVDKLQEIMPQLQELVSMAGGPSGQSEEGEAEPQEDNEPEEDEEGNKIMKDSAGNVYVDKSAFADAKGKYNDKQVEKFTDAAVKSAVRKHAEVIDKARKFLPESYDFTDKDTTDIMRDAVKTETDESFSDAELSLAFKMLKPSARRAEVETFGDRDPNFASKVEALADKEL